MLIRKLKFNELDFDKYTTCIRSSCQYVFQVEKEYMTIVNQENWDFLVYGDYEAVMPVPFVKKMGFKIVLPPMTIQQLGVFSKMDDIRLNDAFYHFLLKEFRVYYYPFNAGNTLSKKVVERKNYVLPQLDYELTKKNYTINRRRNVRLHDKKNVGLVFSETSDLRTLKPFIVKHIIGYDKELVQLKMFSILEKLQKNNILKIYKITKETSVLSVALVVSSDKENYFLNFINDKSISSNAASVMVDQLLQNSIKNKKFSFMGSNVPSVADFYERFGGVLTTYSVIPLSKKRLFKI